MTGVGLDYDAIEKALVAWVMLGTGLDEQHVLLPDGGPQPTDDATFALVLPDTERRIGWDRRAQTANYLSFSPVTFTVSVIPDDPDDPDDVPVDNPADDTLAAPAHGLLTGDGPVRLTTTGGLPGGLLTGTDYWVIKVDAATVQLATSFAGALAGAALDVTVATGIGVQKIVKTSTTRRVGQEVLREAVGDRELDTEIQIISSTSLGNSSARALAGRLVSAGSGLGEMDAILKAAGCALLRMDASQPLSPTQRTVLFEPRAIVRVTLSCKSTVSEKLGVVESLTGTLVVSGATLPLAVS